MCFVLIHGNVSKCSMNLLNGSERGSDGVHQGGAPPPLLTHPPIFAVSREPMTSLLAVSFLFISPRPPPTGALPHPAERRDASQRADG